MVHPSGGRAWMLSARVEALNRAFLTWSPRVLGSPLWVTVSELCLCVCTLAGPFSLGENPPFQLDFQGGRDANILRTPIPKIHFGGWRKDQAELTGLLHWMFPWHPNVSILEMGLLSHKNFAFIFMHNMSIH